VSYKQKITLKTHPNISEKITAFYRGNTEVSVDFSAERVSSDGAAVLLDKLERKHKIISRISGLIPDRRDPSRVLHSVEKLRRQRVFTLMQGYEDCNDAEHLKSDPLFEDTLGGPMASQPTLSRFISQTENISSFWTFPIKRGTGIALNGASPRSRVPLRG